MNMPPAKIAFVAKNMASIRESRRRLRRGRTFRNVPGCVLLAMLLSATSVQAADRWYVETGALDMNFGLAAAAGFEFDWGWSYKFGGGAVKGAWQLGFSSGYWRDAGQNDLMYGVNITPLLRWEMAAPFVLEGGAGVHFLGNRPVRRLSTTTEFGEVAGLYYRYSPALWLGYRFMHLSNGGMKKPNGGINFHLLHIKFAY